MNEGMCLQKISKSDCVEDQEQHGDAEGVNHLEIHGEPTQRRTCFAGDRQQKLKQIEGAKGQQNIKTVMPL